LPNPKPVALEQVLGHVFNDARVLEQSLTHSSLSYERASGRGPANPSETRRHGPGKPGADHDNEQLEFLGDAVLGLVVADFLFRSYRTLNEGDLTRLRAQLVSRKHLGHVAARLSLGDYMRLGRGEERSDQRVHLVHVSAYPHDPHAERGYKHRHHRDPTFLEIFTIGWRSLV